MAKKRTPIITFGLSFLDIMSCGLGAVVLLFLIIKHNAEISTISPITTPDLPSEVSMLEKEILEGLNNLAELRNTISEIDQRMVMAQGLARQIDEDLTNKSRQIKEVLTSTTQDSEIERLKEDLRNVEAERKRQLDITKNTGQDTRSFIGEGNRQYLTGLKLGGDRILILLDTSASMLDDTIVNIIRLRNMTDANKKSAHKWQKALEMTEWLGTRFPVSSKFQIYTFDTRVDAAIPNTKGQWLEVSNTVQLNETFKAIQNITPGGGTSLENVFTEITRLSPMPDNIFLLTDGLPTQGRGPARGTTITGKGRLELFDNAISALPANIPVNIILLPMEGDPMAASAYWQLAQISGGSFMSPSEDWP